MIKFLENLFKSKKNAFKDKANFKELVSNQDIKELFKSFNSCSDNAELRFVGGCVRKLISGEKVDDIDLSTNLKPENVIEVLKKNNINFYETGIEHGTITAVINKRSFEITTLRKDITTDGRHAQVEYTQDWLKDASRRDFTINAIYSDLDGNLFDPFDGKKDLENGLINFIGKSEIRIKEDYLRILRYLRFFTNYSKHPHNLELIRKLKMNIGGISNLSKERLLDELKKISQLESLERIVKNKISLELVQTIFPELKNINIFSKLNSEKKDILKKEDFIFLLSLMIIDKTDNADYFLYKFNISKKDQKRIKVIDNFYKEKIQSKVFSENNMNRIFYYDGKQAVIDILNFQIIKSRKIEKKLTELIDYYKSKLVPKMPIGADFLMKKFNIPEGKQLGAKLKIIEEEWVKNNFEISDKQINSIVDN